MNKLTVIYVIVSIFLFQFYVEIRIKKNNNMLLEENVEELIERNEKEQKKIRFQKQKQIRNKEMNERMNLEYTRGFLDFVTFICFSFLLYDFYIKNIRATFKILKMNKEKYSYIRTIVEFMFNGALVGFALNFYLALYKFLFYEENVERLQLEGVRVSEYYLQSIMIQDLSFWMVLFSFISVIIGVFLEFVRWRRKQNLKQPSNLNVLIPVFYFSVIGFLLIFFLDVGIPPIIQAEKEMKLETEKQKMDTQNKIEALEQETKNTKNQIKDLQEK